MNKGKVILEGVLELMSPLQIGSGMSDISDRDILLNSQDRPYIPASSFIGKLNAVISNQEFSNYLGIDAKMQSKLQLDDLELIDENFTKSLRDGVRINNKTNLVEDGAKFDYQILEPGVFFLLKMYFDIGSEDDYVKCLEWIPMIVSILKESFFIGARSAAGSGELSLQKVKVMKYDFSSKEDSIKYILGKEKDNCDDLTNYIKNINKNIFTIVGDFTIPSSLIVRAYPKSPYGSDAAHLKSNGIPILPGSSVRGALRARGERILNTIWKGDDFVKTFLAVMFGYANVEKNQQYTIPSPFWVNEVVIKEVKMELQNRVLIDRFTGGTIEGALFDSMPVFPSSDEAQIEGLRLSIKDAFDSQKGLLLLIFKDLYHGDLAVGGEKNVGRGCLKGLTASVFDSGDVFENIFGDNQNTEQWDKYIKALVDNTDREEIKKRFNFFVPKVEKGAKNV